MIKIKQDPSFVIGIDPSSTTIACAYLFPDNKFYLDKYDLDSVSGPRACFIAYREMCHYLSCTIIDDCQRYVAYLERPVVGIGGVDTTLVQAYTSGAIQAALYSYSVDVVMVANTRWKKEVVGHGGASKDEIAEWVKQNYPEAFEEADGDQDLLDAICICLYGIEDSKKIRV